MRPNRLVFSVKDRDGNEVRLTESQWRGHILDKRPDMEPYIEEIQEVIRHPEIVKVAEDQSFTLSRFGVVNARQRLRLVVAVAYPDELTGRRLGSVRTAFFTSRRPKGQEVP
jgi:hypothetical protein